MTRRIFGRYVISFGKGTKSPNDYVVFLNGEQIKDDYIFNEIHRYASDMEKAKKILCDIWSISIVDKENEVYKTINEMNYENNIKLVLYIIYHRLIIDDINYPIIKGLNGRRRLLGQIYLLLAKKFGFLLPEYIYSLPKEVFKLGFPDGLTEQVNTQQWLEIYKIFERFTEDC